MLDPVIVDLAVRQLHGRYVDAVFRSDMHAFASCFTEDGQWHIAGIQARGRAEVVDAFAKLTATASRVFMQVGHPVLAIRGETVSSRVYVTECVKKHDGSVMRTVGTYDDVYQGAALEWRFAKRQWTLQYRGSNDFSDPFIDNPDPGAPFHVLD